MGNTFYAKYTKRLIDIVLASLMLLLLSPIILLLALLIKLKIGSPIVFVQERPGKDGTIFKLRKFRTMTNEKDVNGELLPDEDRLTSFGKFIRSTSLDELPSLLNILNGDMSLVGPRPLLVEYLPLYNERQQLRHMVRPGLTGLAQINGRNSISWDEKFEMDIDYINTISFKNDLKILFGTIMVVFNRKDINQDGQVTVTKFKGSDLE